MSSPQMITMLGLCCCATTGAEVMAATDIVVSKNSALVIFMMNASLLTTTVVVTYRKIPVRPARSCRVQHARACRLFNRERYSANAVAGLKLQEIAVHFRKRWIGPITSEVGGGARRCATM